MSARRNRLGAVPGDSGNEISGQRAVEKLGAVPRCPRHVINRGPFELIGSPVMAKGIVFLS